MNGDNAVLGEWPWQAWLQFNNDLVCGGTLITPEWVMTAAHCVLYDDPNKFRVILGDVDRSKTEGSEELFTIKRIIKHRLFSHPVPYENDIALFQLSRPARLGSLINTACLPEFLSEVPVGTKCFISGWYHYSITGLPRVKIRSSEHGSELLRPWECKNRRCVDCIVYDDKKNVL